jgi:hypothetical protein
MSTFTVDFEKAQRAVEELQKNPPSKDEITKDLKGFLAKHGITMDDAMHNMIKTRLGAAQNTASLQAAVIHIDAG